MDRFSVSVKGVLEANGKLLLRKNQRNEYELLGGHLEKEDPTAEQRLITEFAEESGIQIEVLEHREPWLYEVGSKNIIIVPFTCRALRIPEVLRDEDGGTLHWLSAEEAAACFMPQDIKIPSKTKSRARAVRCQWDHISKQSQITSKGTIARRSVSEETDPRF